MSQTLSTKSIMGTLKKNHTKDSSLAPESRVAARLGLTRVVCAALRREHLKLQVDYVKERRRVMITESGYGGFEEPSRLS